MFGFGKKRDRRPGGHFVPDSADIYLGWPLSASHQGNAPGAPLLYDGDRHLLLLGATGTGKGTSILGPNLLHLRDRSVIVIDPKGELAAVTAEHRRSVSDVKILNPFELLGIPSAGFNPLASLNPGAPSYVDDVLGLADAMVVVDPRDPHWGESAQLLLAAFIMWEIVLARRERRLPDLINVRRMLTEPDEYEVVDD